MKSKRRRLWLAIQGSVILSLLSYVYLTSELRTRVENKLYDFRVRAQPHMNGAAPVQVVDIDQKTLDLVAEGRDLSFAQLSELLKKILQEPVTKLVVFIPPQIFDYSSPEFLEILKISDRDPRLYFGLFANLPEKYQEYRQRVLKSELKRDFRKSVIRDVGLIEDGKGIDGLMKGPVSLANDNLPKSFRLNYLKTPQLSQISAADIFLEKEAAISKDVVFLGYGVFRAWTIDFREATHVNTPWNFDGGDVKNGTPIFHVQAMIYANAIEKSWIAEGPTALEVVQVLLIVFAILWFFKHSLTSASLATIFVLCGLFAVHVVLLAVWHIFIPLANTFLFATLAMFCGLSLKLTVVSREKAAHEASAQTHLELSRLQNRFLSRFAHELGDLSRKVKLHILRHRHLEKGTGRVTDIYQRMILSVTELEEFLVGIEQVSKIKAGESVQPLWQEIAVDSTVDSIIKAFEGTAHEKNISIEKDLPQLFVTTDRGMFSQILKNLISNAIKYSPEGSVIKVGARHLGKGFEVYIKDQGPGIDASLQDKIFEKFYRIKDDFVYQIRGHGLGLFLSQYFAKFIRGKIKVVSKVGEGSTFSLVIR